MATTLLIALDGATYTIMEPMMKKGTMPFFSKLVTEGAHGILMSTEHPLTPPAFTTMITGRGPGRHGLLDFIKGEDDGSGVFFTLYDARDNRCETLWSMANRQNRKVMALNFVMSTPVTPVCGYIVPGMTHWKHLRRHMHPTEFYEKLKAQSWFDPKVMCWDFDHMEKAITSKPEMSSAEWVRDHIGRERQWFQVMRFLMKKDPADLMAIVFDGVDKVQHVCWDLMDPATRPANPTPEQAETLKLIDQYFSELDGFIKELVDLAGSRARTFITSDHGFGPFYLTVRLNQFLHEQGLLFWNEGEGSEADAEGLNLDWSRTVAYCPTQSSNGIFIRVADQPGKPGIDPAKYDEVRNGLIAKVRELRDPVTNEPVVKDVLLREKSFAGPGMKRAPDITLVLVDHGFVNTSPGARVVDRKPEVKGTHYPEGVFIAYGDGIQKGAKLPRLAMVDVAPALLHSLGLPIPSNLEGHVPVEAFDAEWMQENPIEAGAPAREAEEAPEAPKSAEPSSEDAKKEVYEQLRALGYIE
ncbi:MAG TPA: alkaline phosphatase family protein [Kiritimatiellia bacterium]|nr:alkaline phosphatase family protein [Kiritimatiellia bacterium]